MSVETLNSIILLAQNYYFDTIILPLFFFYLIMLNSQLCLWQIYQLLPPVSIPLRISYVSHLNLYHYPFTSVNSSFLSPTSILLAQITQMSRRGPLQTYGRRFLFSFSTLVKREKRQYCFPLEAKTPSHWRNSSIFIQQGDNNTGPSHPQSKAFLPSLCTERESYPVPKLGLVLIPNEHIRFLGILIYLFLVILDDRVYDDCLSHIIFNYA